MSSDELTGIAEKAARGGMFLFVGNTSSTVILAVGSIVIARLLGPSGYGLYSLTLLAPVLLVSFADVGMSYALVRLPAKLRSEGDFDGTSRMIQLGFLLKLSVSLMAFLACYVGADLIAVSLLNRPELAGLLRLASVLIVFQAIYGAVINSFVGLDLMQYTAGTQLLQSALKTVVAPALILVGLGIAGALIGNVLGMLIGGATGAVLLFTKKAKPTKKTTRSLSLELNVLLSYSLPLYLASVLSAFLTQYQNIVLAHLATNVEIGNFNAAWNFNSFLVIVSYPVTTAIIPMFSKMDPQNRRSDLIRAFELAVKYASLLMIPASVAVMVLSRDLINVTYGAGYTLAPGYLVLLAVFYLLYLLSYDILVSFLYGVADTGTALKIGILTFAVFIPLGPVLAWFLGGYGLIIALIISSTISTVYGVRRASRKFGVRLQMKTNARILLAAFLSAIPTIALLQVYVTGTSVMNVIFGGLVYLASYLTLAPICGAVNSSDIDNLRTIFFKTRMIARLTKPIFGYEERILSMTSKGETGAGGTVPPPTGP